MAHNGRRVVAFGSLLEGSRCGVIQRKTGHQRRRNDEIGIVAHGGWIVGRRRTQISDFILGQIVPAQVDRIGGHHLLIRRIVGHFEGCRRMQMEAVVDAGRIGEWRWLWPQTRLLLLLLLLLMLLLRSAAGCVAQLGARCRFDEERVAVEDGWIEQVVNQEVGRVQQIIQVVVVIQRVTVVRIPAGTVCKLHR